MQPREAGANGFVDRIVLGEMLFGREVAEPEVEHRPGLVMDFAVRQP